MPPGRMRLAVDWSSRRYKCDQIYFRESKITDLICSNFSRQSACAETEGFAVDKGLPAEEKFAKTETNLQN
jgi:hypothetical protein